MRSVRLGFVCASLASSIVATTSTAGAITFDQITNNSGQNYADDFSASITDAGSGKVWIRFMNAPGASGLIGTVYIDDDDSNLVSIEFSAAQSSPGVLFEVGSGPPNLPAGNLANPAFDAHFRAGKKGAASNGVDAGETLALLATLQAGSSVAEILADLAQSRFRLALHGQSLGPGEDSESFVDPPPLDPPLSAPATAFLFALGAWAALRGRPR
ncbi:MAG: hypothetical protein FJX67_13230 [Alphaproteobacteria bacterium]|nr:hypothetical protein [Alphaproteobacteria bacterium]